MNESINPFVIIYYLENSHHALFLYTNTHTQTQKFQEYFLLMCAWNFIFFEDFFCSCKHAPLGCGTHKVYLKCTLRRKGKKERYHLLQRVQARDSLSVLERDFALFSPNSP